MFSMLSTLSMANDTRNCKAGNAKQKNKIEIVGILYLFIGSQRVLVTAFGKNLY